MKILWNFYESMQAVMRNWESSFIGLSIMGLSITHRTTDPITYLNVCTFIRMSNCINTESGTLLLAIYVTVKLVSWLCNIVM